ncbi:hypothetical protein B7L88_gp094 [Rhizobium phage RHEph10]|uniref:hypothetical protein n=1 Tax=Rhizobium phage RHEph10 TaxID=1220717 RepID=UPI0002AB7C63|nr:hypothetical protein B7L88_gp094 [Rhizobium phage RHEph10]AGC36194.1 hypothetical protein RHEph10_gp151 [Rhizobium phage RHEph10]
MPNKEPSLPFGFPLEGIPLAGKFPEKDVVIQGDTIYAGLIAPDVTLHTPLPVTGYTPVEDDKVQLVNSIKIEEERILRRLDELKAGGQKYDQRFVALAMTYVQVGMMLAYRGVFQPERITLPEDAA